MAAGADRPAMTSAEPLQFQQLLPEPRAVHVEQLVADAGLAARASADRPYVVANLVASADGRATFRARSGELGDEGDLAIFRALRRSVDAVLVGTGTLGAEHYGRLIGDPAARRRREQGGLAPEPLVCIFTRSGHVPLEIPLFDEPEAAVIVFGPAGLETPDVAARVEVVGLGPQELTPLVMLSHLRRRHDVRSLLCEGGPTLLGALLADRLVDELYMTLAPKLTGGGGPAITSGPELSELISLTPEWVLERAGSLFLRYSLAV
jgi:riboflavin biosynthesis pyrimidine reductase